MIFQAHSFAHFDFEFGGSVLIFLEVNLGIFAALADAFTVVAVPGAGFFHDVVEDAQIEHIAQVRDALAVHDVEFSLAERSSSLVLHNFNPGAGADYDVAFFQGLDAADIHAHGRIKFEGAAAGGGLWIAEHHSDLFTDLVDEDHARAALGHDAGQLTHGLRHQARLQSHVAFAHLAFEFRFGNEGGH